VYYVDIVFISYEIVLLLVTEYIFYSFWESLAAMKY
jgi:hypothetical protein